MSCVRQQLKLLLWESLLYVLITHQMTSLGRFPTVWHTKPQRILLQEWERHYLMSLNLSPLSKDTTCLGKLQPKDLWSTQSLTKFFMRARMNPHKPVWLGNQFLCPACHRWSMEGWLLLTIVSPGTRSLGWLLEQYLVQETMINNIVRICISCLLKCSISCMVGKEILFVSVFQYQCRDEVERAGDSLQHHQTWLWSWMIQQKSHRKHWL